MVVCNRVNDALNYYLQFIFVNYIHHFTTLWSFCEFYLYELFSFTVHFLCFVWEMLQQYLIVSFRN